MFDGKISDLNIHFFSLLRAWLRMSVIPVFAGFKVGFFKEGM